MDFIVDTGFLIGRWRGGAASAEQRFIESHADQAVAMPWIVKAEFLRGAALAGHATGEVADFLDRFATLWPSDETLQVYVRLFVELRRSNGMVGPHDLWIAASAVEHGLPLLTRNGPELGRIPGLRIVDLR